MKNNNRNEIDFLTLLLKINLTSWANARVKLHSQVPFESKKILGPKKVRSKKVLIPKIFWVLS